ncbi:TPA: hypothetical protein U5E44_002366 [Yersinia enterocolitica]|uniref:hypothetical protein n=1 Tax=Yersinia proxima TaxID=2890316 RepID=UPI001D11CE33|nr:hypothetical protein [Yersinia proxima]HEN3609170.1 hypothetical protein [Yersinia enterocolitica]HEN3641545.1 hypothetical protein [Yersinia enterocolitica]
MKISTIKYYQVTLYEPGLQEIPRIGYNRNPDLEVKDGFVILRDEKQTSTYGIPLSSIGAYAINPVFDSEDSDKQ